MLAFSQDRFFESLRPRNIAKGFIGPIEKMGIVFVAFCLADLIESMLKRDFPNGDGIILLHGALAKPNVDGLKSQKTLILVIS